VDRILACRSDFLILRAGQRQREQLHGAGSFCDTRLQMA
jgi:hypothetical protein